MKVRLALAAGLMLFDTFTTVILFHSGLIVEANPIMAVVLAHGTGLFILVKVALTAAVCGLILLIGKRDAKRARMYATVVLVAYLALYLMGIIAVNLS
jgi:hypothetical protein